MFNIANKYGLCTTFYCMLCIYCTYDGCGAGCCIMHHTGAAAHCGALTPAALSKWQLPSPPITPSNPPDAYRLAILLNPLRLDPTPMPVPLQSDNPIRTHTAGKLAERLSQLLRTVCK